MQILTKKKKSRWQHQQLVHENEQFSEIDRCSFARNYLSRWKDLILILIATCVFLALEKNDPLIWGLVAGVLGVFWIFIQERQRKYEMEILYLSRISGAS